MPDAWAKAIAGIAALLKQWGAALAAYFAGRASARRKIGEAGRQALEKELEAEHEEDRLLSDPDELARLRERHRRVE